MQHFNSHSLILINFSSLDFPIDNKSLNFLLDINFVLRISIVTKEVQ